MPSRLVAFNGQITQKTAKFTIEPNVTMWELAFGTIGLDSVSIDIWQGDKMIKSVRTEIGKSKGKEIIDGRFKGEFWLHVWCNEKWSVVVNVWP